MKDRQLFRVKVIKSEEDLPKEDDEYFVHYKEYGMGSTHIYLGNDARKYTWLNDIDWYLIPDLTNDSDIEAHFTTLHYDNKNGHHYRINKDRIFGAKAVLNGEINHIEK